MNARAQRLEVVGPTYRDRDVTYGVFDDQIPADDPGDDFAKGRVRVGVGRARYRNHRGEFGITERCKRADDGSDHERNHQRGSGAGAVRIARRGSADSGEDPGADDCAYPKKGELDGTESTLELMFRLFGVFENRIEWFDPEQPAKRRSIDARLIG